MHMINEGASAIVLAQVEDLHWLVLVPLVWLKRFLGKNFTYQPESCSVKFWLRQFFQHLFNHLNRYPKFWWRLYNWISVYYRNETWEGSIDDTSLNASEFIFLQCGNDCNKRWHVNIFVIDLRLFAYHCVSCNVILRNCVNVFGRFKYVRGCSANFDVSVVPINILEFYFTIRD